MKSRNNHYIPEWYQKHFLSGSKGQLYYLNLSPEPIMRPDGKPVVGADGKQKFYHAVKPTAPDGCFVQKDLYSTFLAPIIHDAFINDDIERLLFGEIDSKGANAVRAFIEGGFKKYHENFHNFFEYMDVQKLRTPKGLRWIANQYTRLDQNTLMREMQALRQRHCAVWMGGVREIVSARNSKTKFIISDHPITIYNSAMPQKPGCVDDPSILLRGSQTIFPLDQDTCLILSNLEHAENPNEKPLERRTNPRLMSQSLVMTDKWIRVRELNDSEVASINYITKCNALRYVAAGEKEWLFPEKTIETDWIKVGQVLLPPSNQLHQFGGEMFVGYEDGTVRYQDAFGRTSKVPEQFVKRVDESKLRANHLCGCGSGRPYKKCCRGLPERFRPSWKTRSIRERNMAVFRGMTHILGLNDGLNWQQAREQLTDEKVRRIYEVLAAFWPTETNLYELLPKPDGRSRTVFMGLIDARTIASTAISATMYHDEVIVQFPMFHPECIKPEFNPLLKPERFHHEVIRTYVLLEILMPYIDCGMINFVPDVTIFDEHLRHLAMKLPKERLNKGKISKDELALMDRLHMDDFRRSVRMIPEEAQRRQLARLNPEMSQEDLDQSIEYIRQESIYDPLTPLTKNAFGKSGQMTSFNLVPNLEVGLMLAQITGATITTDSPFRWQELQSCRQRFGGMPLTMFGRITDDSSGYPIRIRANPEDIFNLRIKDAHQSLRNALRDFVSAVRNAKDFKLAEKVETKAMAVIAAETASLNDVLDKMETQSEESLPNIPAKLRMLAPLGGISHHHTQRILALSGLEGYLTGVPVAFHLEFEPYRSDDGIDDIADIPLADEEVEDVESVANADAVSVEYEVDALIENPT